uniref:Uncharacterized protein n=1 Tax=Panagrolaimus sp. ES5 TaxID=591445 RepID=A0AC34GJT0_9BILA
MASEADIKPDAKDIKLEEEDIKPDIASINFPAIDFSQATSTSIEDTPPLMDFKVKQEIDVEDENENCNPCNETIDLSSDDEPMDIKPCDNTDLFNFLSTIKNEPCYGLQMPAENSFNAFQEVVDLTKDDVKKQVDDYLSRFAVEQVNTDDVITIEDDNEEYQKDVKIEMEEEQMSCAASRVVEIETLAPLD